MREIEFRQWLNGGFHYWGVGSDTFTGPLSNRLDIPSEQFTGLRDKNGKKIFEWDIVKETEHWRQTYAVEYADGYWNIYEDHHHCEIIGNIHENPELLNAH